MQRLNNINSIVFCLVLKYCFQSIALGPIGNLLNAQCLVEQESKQEPEQKVLRRSMEEYVQEMLQNRKIAIHRIVQVKVIFEIILTKMIIFIPKIAKSKYKILLFRAMRQRRC